MNLVEDFAQLGTPDRGLTFTNEDGYEELSPSGTFDSTLLAIEGRQIRQAARGRGTVVGLACCSDVVVVATSRGYLLRYSWDEADNERVTEVEVTRAADARIQRLYVDPHGHHVLAAVAHANGAVDNYYVHHRATKPRLLPKLRNVSVTAVGWQPMAAAAAAAAAGGRDASSAAASGPGAATEQQPKAAARSSFFGLRSATDASSSSSSAEGAAWEPSESCTGEVLLGTGDGRLLLLVVEEAQRQEALLKEVYDFRDRREAVCSVLQELLPLPPLPSPGEAAGAAADGQPLLSLAQQRQQQRAAQQKAVFIATSEALYVAAGPQRLQPLFERYSRNSRSSAAAASGAAGDAGGSAAAALAPVLHATGGPCSNSSLQLLRPGNDPHSHPTLFAWLAGSVVYHGSLALTSAVAELPTADASSSYLASINSLPLDAPAAAAAQSRPRTPPRATPAVAAATAAAEEPLPPQPLALQLSEYHFLLLWRDRLQAVNRISGKPAHELPIKPPAAAAAAAGPAAAAAAVAGLAARPQARGGGGGGAGAGAAVSAGAPLGLLKDPASGSTYLATSEALLEVGLTNEGADMWRVYLTHGDYDQALRLCRNAAQRNVVYADKAQSAMERADLVTAAVSYALLTGGSGPPFEEVALKLMEAEAAASGGGSSEGLALQAYLSTKLQSLGPSDRAQATMLGAWLTELQLDRINKALLEAGGTAAAGGAAGLNARSNGSGGSGGGSAGGAPGAASASGAASAKVRQLEGQLRSFLAAHVEVLDLGTTMGLLGAYGRSEELLHYATCRNDNEAVLEQLLQRPGGALAALGVLRKPSCSQQLVYRFAPALLAAAPRDAVDFFIAARPALDARRLLPALLRFGEPTSSMAVLEGRQHVMRYVEFALLQLGTSDQAFHNLAVALYALQPEEGPLLAYLARAQGPLGSPLYDASHALRLARERGKPRAAVQLLCTLGMYEDAVGAALAIDLALAKAVANRPPEEEEGLRRKLWLLLAQAVVQRQVAAAPADGSGAAAASAIRQAVEFIKEANGLLQIEDILPCFPDCATIDNFREAICESLERYDAQIEELKAEMDEATEIAELVRADLKKLGSRTASLSITGTACTRCRRPLSEAPAPGGAAAVLPHGGAIPPFYLFPTGQAYHAVCCAAEVLELVGPQQAAKIRGLLAKLARVKVPGGARAAVSAAGGVLAAIAGGAAGGGDKEEEEVRALQAALAGEIAGEDPRNGEVLLLMVDKPFVSEQDAAEVEAWSVQ